MRVTLFMLRSYSNLVQPILPWKHWLLIPFLIFPPVSAQPKQVISTYHPAEVRSIPLALKMEPLEAAQRVETLPVPSYTPEPVTTPYAGAGDAKSFIYEHESGNDPTKWNSSGCVGLGQACPASKLLAVCPNLDYACEDAWFTDYMFGKYKTWENAKAFWLARVPINGRDVGNWW